MKRLLLRSSPFLRAAKKCVKKNPPAAVDIQSALELLSADALHVRLKTHKLKGSLEGSWACSAGYDLRIVFRFVTWEATRKRLFPRDDRDARRCLLIPGEARKWPNPSLIRAAQSSCSAPPSRRNDRRRTPPVAAGQIVVGDSPTAEVTGIMLNGNLCTDAGHRLRLVGRGQMLPIRCLRGPGEKDVRIRHSTSTGRGGEAGRHDLHPTRPAARTVAAPATAASDPRRTVAPVDRQREGRRGKGAGAAGAARASPRPRHKRPDGFRPHRRGRKTPRATVPPPLGSIAATWPLSRAPWRRKPSPAGWSAIGATDDAAAPVCPTSASAP